jgi:hypothetical protein
VLRDGEISRRHDGVRHERIVREARPSREYASQRFLHELVPPRGVVDSASQDAAGSLLGICPPPLWLVIHPIDDSR